MRLPLAGLYRICMFLPLLALPSLFFGPWALCFLAACVLNTALYYHAKDKIRAHLDTLGYFSMLLSAAKRLSRLVQTDAPQLSDALNDAARPLKAVSSGVGALARPSTGELNDMLFELMGALTLAPLLYYDRAVRVMQREHAALLRLCMLLGETELAIAALSFRESLSLRCTPEFTFEMALVCDELYHPLLETPVANSAVFRRHTLFTTHCSLVPMRPANPHSSKHWPSTPFWRRRWAYAPPVHSRCPGRWRYPPWRFPTTSAPETAILWRS